MAIGLTPMMADCCRVVEELTAAGGRPPTLTAIAAELDTAKGNVPGLLRRIAARGWLALDDRGRPLPTRPAPPLPAFGVAVTAEGRAAVAAYSSQRRLER